MPTFASAIKTLRIPVVGLTPESTSTAPTSPVNGQLYTDTSVTPKVVRVWDGAGWQPVNLYAGTTAGTYTAGNDTRVVNAEQTTNKGVANGYASLDGSIKVPIAQVPTATSGTSSATLVPLANDSRLSDQRVPTDNSVTGGPAGAGVKIQANTITDVNVATANKDGLTTVASLRTLGLGSQQAMPGNTTLNAITAPTASVSLNGQTITGLGAPVNPSDAARYQDITTAAAGIDSKPSARLLATGNLTLSGLSPIDAITPIAGDRILAIGQSTASQNGIYVAASGAWARAGDTITPNSVWFIEEGTVNHDTAWWVINDGTITIGTTNISISQFAGPTTITGTANRITVNGTQIDISTAYVGQNTITTLGTITTGVWNGTTIAVANGGTGSTTALGARGNLNVPQRGYAGTNDATGGNPGAITAGTAAVWTHGLNTQDVIAQLRDATTNEYIYADVVNASASTVSVTTGVAYGQGAVRIVILPVQ